MTDTHYLINHELNKALQKKVPVHIEIFTGTFNIHNQMSCTNNAYPIHE